MATQQEYSNKVLTLLNNGNVEKILSCLSAVREKVKAIDEELADRIVLINGRYNGAKDDLSRNLITRDSFQRIKAEIANTIPDLISELPDEISYPEINLSVSGIAFNRTAVQREFINRLDRTEPVKKFQKHMQRVAGSEKPVFFINRGYMGDEHEFLIERFQKVMVDEMMLDKETVIKIFNLGEWKNHHSDNICNMVRSQ